MFCRNCGNVLTESETICRTCGFAVGTGELFCAECGSEVYPYAVCCDTCGSTISHSFHKAKKQQSTQTYADVQIQQQPVQMMQRSGVAIMPAREALMPQTVTPRNLKPASYGRKTGKSHKKALRLAILLGFVGAQDAYLGYYGNFVLHLLMCIAPVLVRIPFPFFLFLPIISEGISLLEISALLSRSKQIKEKRRLGKYHKKK